MTTNTIRLHRVRRASPERIYRPDPLALLIEAQVAG